MGLNLFPHTFFRISRNTSSLLRLSRFLFVLKCSSENWINYFCDCCANVFVYYWESIVSHRPAIRRTARATSLEIIHTFPPLNQKKKKKKKKNLPPPQQKKKKKKKKKS